MKGGYWYMDYFNMSPEEMAKIFERAMPVMSFSKWGRPTDFCQDTEPICVSYAAQKEIETLREKDVTHIFLNPENAKTWLMGFPYPPCLSSGFIRIPIEERAYIPMDSIILVRRDKSIKIIKVVSK